MDRQIFILTANVTNPKPDKRIKTPQVHAISVYPANSLWLRQDVTPHDHDGAAFFSWSLRGHYGSLNEHDPQFLAVREYLKPYEFASDTNCANVRREFNALKLLLDQYESNSYYEMLLRYFFHADKISVVDIKEAWANLDGMSEEDWRKI